MSEDHVLQGKVAIVTGATRGMGEEIALAYARAGADVVVFGRTEDDLHRVGQAIEQIGARALAVQGDIRDEQEVRQLFRLTMEKFGAVDVLVNNAGVGMAVSPTPVRTLLDVDPDTWDVIYDTNVRGLYLMTREVLPVMLSRESGSIINVSSGLVRHVVAGTAPYASSKAAVEHFTRVLAEEVKDRHIRVNSLHPGGMVDTAFFAPEMRERLGEGMLKPDVITPAAIYLASDASSAVTGVVFDAREWSERQPCPPAS